MNQINKLEYLRLCNELKQAAIAYYSGTPFMSDSQYDSKYKQLLKMEEDDPSMISQDSPTQTIHAPGGNIFHQQFMGSIKSYDTADEIVKWCTKVNLGGMFYCDMKMDGLAIELVYKKGILVSISTRGDGMYGENITHNLKLFSNVPKQFDHIKLDITVYGEAILDMYSFDILQDGDKTYSNPRNAVAGIIRSKTPSEEAYGVIDFIPYGAISKEYKFYTQEEKINFLHQLGFQWNNHVHPIVTDNTSDIIDYYNKCKKEREGNGDLDYEIDGVVIKVQDVTRQEELGYGAKSPRWAIGWKFPAKGASTILREVEWNIGRTGRLAPKGIIDPVTIDNVTITKVNLHGIDRIRELDLKIGSHVVVARLKDVIPGIQLVGNPPSGIYIEIKEPTICPNCELELIRDGAYIVCPNPSCSIKNIKSIVFRLRECGIKGIGEKIIETIMTSTKLRTYEEVINIDQDTLVLLFGKLQGFKIHSYFKSVR